MVEGGEESRTARAIMRRRRIAETAHRLFVTKGFHGTGVAQIAAESDIKIGQLYRDFSCKEDIVAEIVQNHVGSFLDESELCKAAKDRDPAAAHAWLRRFLADGDHMECSGGCVAKDDCAMFAEINAEASRNQRIATIVRSTDAHLRLAIATALEIMAPGPSLADRRMLLAHVILSLGYGIWYRRIVAPELPIATLGIYSLSMIDREIEELAEAGRRKGGTS